MSEVKHGSAFPYGMGTQPDQYESSVGMSLRDWFAGQALHTAASRFGSHAADHPAVVAHDAYILAGAMLAERSK